MKKEKNKIRGHFDVINDIKKVFDENINSIPVNEIEKVNMLFSEANEIKIKNKHDGNIAGYVVIAFFIFIITMGIFGAIDNYNMNNDNYQKALIINKLESSNEMLNRYIWGEKSKDIKQKDTITKYSYYVDNKGNILTYAALNKSNDSLKHTNFLKDIEIRNLNSKLNTIKRYYGISDSSQNELIASKLDSALMLYPVYKDSLRYDKIKKGWYIYR